MSWREIPLIGRASLVFPQGVFLENREKKQGEAHLVDPKFNFLQIFGALAVLFILSVFC